MFKTSIIEPIHSSLESILSRIVSIGIQRNADTTRTINRLTIAVYLTELCFFSFSLPSTDGLLFS